MNFDIDNIVRQILTDLTVKPEPVCIEAKKTNEIYLDSRVVSLAEIKERLGSATKLFISPKSILTPSAKDEIRKRKIEIAVKLSPLTSGHCSTLWLALHQPVSITAGLVNRLKKDLILKQESFETLAELIDEAEKQLSNEKTCGVALTKQAATAICSANRRNTLRAVSGIDPKQTAEDTVELDANLLIVQPRRINETEIFDVIKKFIHR